MPSKGWWIYLDKLPHGITWNQINPYCIFTGAQSGVALLYFINSVIRYGSLLEVVMISLSLSPKRFLWQAVMEAYLNRLWGVSKLCYIQRWELWNMRFWFDDSFLRVLMVRDFGSSSFSGFFPSCPPSGGQWGENSFLGRSLVG